MNIAHIHSIVMYLGVYIMVGRRIVGGCGNTVRQVVSLHRLPLAPTLWVSSSVKTTRKFGKDWNVPCHRSLLCSAQKDAFDPHDLKISLD